MTTIPIKSRKDVLRKMAHIGERFDLEHEVDGFKYQKERHIFKWGKTSW